MVLGLLIWSFLYPRALLAATAPTAESCVHALLGESVRTAVRGRALFFEQETVKNLAGMREGNVDFILRDVDGGRYVGSASIEFRASRENAHVDQRFQCSLMTTCGYGESAVLVNDERGQSIVRISAPRSDNCSRRSGGFRL